MQVVIVLVEFHQIEIGLNQVYEPFVVHFHLNSLIFLMLDHSAYKLLIFS